MDMMQHAFKLFEALNARLDAIDVKLGMLIDQKNDRDAAAKLSDDVRTQRDALKGAIPTGAAKE